MRFKLAVLRPVKQEMNICEAGMRCEALNRVTAPILGAKVAKYGAPYGIHAHCGGKLHCHGRNVWIVMVYMCVCLVGGGGEGAREGEGENLTSSSLVLILVLRKPPT